MSTMIFLNSMVTGPVLNSNSVKDYKPLVKEEKSDTNKPISFYSKQDALPMAEYAKEGKTILNNSFFKTASQEEVMKDIAKYKNNPDMQAKTIFYALMASGNGMGTNEEGMNAAIYSINAKNLPLVEKYVKERIGVSLSEYIDSELSKGESKDLYRHINQFKK